MKEKIKKKKIWNEEGVSEIFGDMMILAITTTLFTVVFLMIYSLPTPDGDVYAEFESGLELNGEGAEIDVTHSGGETLVGHDTKIYLYNGEDEVRILDTQGEDEDNPSYGIEGDAHWDPGETWSYYYHGITPESDLRISVVDLKSDKLVMSSYLLGCGLNTAPIVMERWYQPLPAQNDSVTSIFVKVFDPNGCDDLDKVYFNGSKLNASMGDVLMEDPEGDGVFCAEVFISKGIGDYELTIFALDFEGNLDYGRLDMNVEQDTKPIIEFVIIAPNSIEVGSEFEIRAVIVDMNNDLNFSSIEVEPEQKFYDKSGTIETSFTLSDETPNGGVFETTGSSPNSAGVYDLMVSACDYEGYATAKNISLSVIKNVDGNGSYNDSIWAYLGPESLDFKKFYYTIDNPPSNSTTYHLAVYVEEEHIGDACFLHINIINHYYEDVYIDGNSKIRLLQIGGAASNKDISIVQNGSDFGEEVGMTPDGSWYKIPAPEDGDYFHGGEPVSLVFGPFDLSSAKEGDLFGTILVLTGSYNSESLDAEKRYGQTLPFQAILIT